MIKQLPKDCKLFISQSMQHSTAEKIKAERDHVLEMLKELYPNTNFTLIEQCYVKDPESWKDKNPRELRWARLGRSIEMMATANLIVFVDNGIDTDIAPGCKSELTVALEYQKEYPNDYFIMHEYQLEYELSYQKAPQFSQNIIECVKSDIDRYNKYWYALISVVKKHLPDIDLDDFLITDTENDWVLDYSSPGSISITASLDKCVLIDQPDYDDGEFFKFGIEIPINVLDIESARIIIRSFYRDDIVNGIKVYECTNSSVPFIKEMFEELKAVCKRETNKRYII